VTWVNLLASRNVQRHRTSKRELDDMRPLVARDLADSGVTGLSADRRVATAYNAALQTANMAVACAGHRANKVTVGRDHALRLFAAKAPGVRASSWVQRA